MTFPQVKTIIYSGLNDRAFNARAKDAGAWGCVSKGTDPSKVLQAVREVVAGKVVFPDLDPTRRRASSGLCPDADCTPPPPIHRLLPRPLPKALHRLRRRLLSQTQRCLLESHGRGNSVLNQTLPAQLPNEADGS